LKNKSVSDILGKWVDPNSDSSLLSRCKTAWEKPITEITNEELATFLRQDIALSLILPEARKRISNNYDDDSEMYDGELKAIADEINLRYQNK
jgi:hypothetical protein